MTHSSRMKIRRQIDSSDTCPRPSGTSCDEEDGVESVTCAQPEVNVRERDQRTLARESTSNAVAKSPA